MDDFGQSGSYRRMTIQKDCYGTIAINLVLILAMTVIVLLSIPILAISLPICAVLLCFAVFVVWFHRVPVRNCSGSAKTLSAVADGKIVIIDKVFEKEYLRKECIMVSIYMNFFDVHVNFWPLDGNVTYYRYHPGKYLLAFHPKSSELNEHSSTAVKSGEKEILFKQIAGTFARRIVCYSKEGLEVKAGGQCGVIKFGSRIDMFLPTDADIKVKLGERVRACESVIAELK